MIDAAKNFTTLVGIIFIIIVGMCMVKWVLESYYG
jgi:hypothetical protein